MMSHVMLLSLLIASNTCWADILSAQRACLYDNGLNNSTDIKRLEELLKFKSTITTTERDVVFEDKLACAIACGFHVAKERNVTLFGKIETVINADNQLDVELKKEMKETLEACHATDEDDDCTLLKCIKIFQPPFLRMFIKMFGHP